MLAEAVAGALGDLLGPSVERRPVSGGDINEALCWQTDDAAYFVKWNARLGRKAFQAEANGLAELAQAGHVRVPETVAVGEADGAGYLVLEWLEFTPPGQGAWRDLGTRLAKLHATTSKQGFGFRENNLIGRLPQFNSWRNDWPRFWAENRIGAQLRMAVDTHRLDRAMVERIERLCRSMPELTGLSDGPSLLHGDLWGGNVEFVDDEPCLIDPAVYYGDREVELAFTELFGGFAAEFYAAYDEALPLRDGYALRRSLWQLYPMLVHLNHFGGGYLPGVERCVSQAERRL